MTKGNGVFKWWAARHEEDETFMGPFDTKEEAVAAGTETFLAQDLEESFVVMEWDKTVATYCGVNEAALVERIVEELGEGNIECWSEDGWDDAWDADELKELEQDLAATISKWIERHPAGTWSVNELRSMERITAKAAA